MAIYSNSVRGVYSPYIPIYPREGDQNNAVMTDPQQDPLQQEVLAQATDSTVCLGSYDYDVTKLDATLDLGYFMA